MLLYISGSFPNNQEGIADAAKILLNTMLNYIDKDSLLLLTTDKPIISESITDNTEAHYELMPDWHIRKNNIDRIYSILDKYKVSVIHMDYPGDLYGKTFLASFIPYLVHKYNKRNNTEIKVNIRLHEFSRARFLRKLAIMPILFSADAIYVPAKTDRKIVGIVAKKRVHPTYIGTNITVVDDSIVLPEDKIVISYFGSVYPGKGIKRMLNIWKQLKETDYENRFVFKIIGDIGIESTNHFSAYHKQVWKWIEQYGLKNSVEVTGYLSDEEVSYELQHSYMAVLLYEDGLTLRRGSFLAYLAHGIPIVTTEGDAEAKELFAGHPGISMCSSDNSVINSVLKYSSICEDERNAIHSDNINLSKTFSWDVITRHYLENYGILSSK